MQKHIITSVIALLFASSVSASPFERLLAKPVEADSSKSYYLAQTNGPWMILAKTFTGPNAEANANRLALELRKTYKQKAYVFNKEFRPELNPEDVIQMYDQFGRPKKMKYQTDNAIEEYSVLIGDFQSPEDNDFQKALGTIKKIRPESLKTEGVSNPAKSLFTNAPKTGGPFEMAFAAPNPLLPPDYFGRKGVDPFVLKLNSDSAHSLLNCKGKKTLQVATFTGRVEIRQDKIKEVLDGKKELIASDSLVQAGQKASDLCAALRKKGYEAFEFHDRETSIVTVGSFEFYEVKQPNGEMYRNPEVIELAKLFMSTPAQGGIRLAKDGASVLPIEQKKLIGIPFDVTPKIIDVPRKN